MKLKIFIPATFIPLSGAMMLVPAAVPAQNLFESDAGSGNFYEFTPNGTLNTFASGFSRPSGLAFNSAGQLIVADNSANITEISPSGEKSTFATGLNYTYGLAFNNAGDLFATSGLGPNKGGSIIEITPDGMKNTFAHVSSPAGLAFDEAGDLFISDNFNGTIIEFTPAERRAFLPLY